jgi:hypothetical protein
MKIFSRSLVFLFTVIACSKNSSSDKPDARELFVGTWKLQAEVTSPTGPFSYDQNVIISKGTGANALLLDFGNNVKVTSTLKDSLVTIPAQVVDGATISGQIFYDGSVLNFSMSSKTRLLTINVEGLAEKGSTTPDPRDIFVGLWKGTGTSTCSPDAGSSNGSCWLQITSSTTDNTCKVQIGPVSIKNILGAALKGTVSANKITFADQGDNLFGIKRGEAVLTGSILTNNQSLTFIYSQVIYPNGVPSGGSTCLVDLSLKKN